jgi:hypothetical protein
MRLTKSDKEAFVRAVMADVPMIDYDDQAGRLLQEAAVKDMPATVFTVYVDTRTRHYLHTERVWTPGCLQTAHIYHGRGWKPSEELKAKLDELSELKRQQAQAQLEIQSKIQGVINSCTTLKRAQELLPEFAKYLPAERETQAQHAPAITGLVVDLTKLGWPKGTKPAAVAA